MYVKVDELLNIFHFQHDVALECTCKFSKFKYYSRIHQTSNQKINLKLNLMSHFQTYLLSIYIVPKFSEFCNQFIINSKKGTMLLLCYLKLFKIYFFLLLLEIGPFFDCFGDNYFFLVYFIMFSSLFPL
jgi:hypothetical protein